MTLTSETLGYVVENFFYIICAICVYLQQAGFAMYETGNVRKANIRTILVKNFIDTCISAICFWLVGYTLAYGTNDSSLKSFSGANGLALQDGLYTRWFVSWVFGATTTSIVSGAIAERCQMGAYFLSAVCMSSFVYPVISHWCYSSDGWLSMYNTNGDDTADTIGVLDFAGSGVVHITGGIGALVGAIVVGPRAGRFIKASEISFHDDDDGRLSDASSIVNDEFTFTSSCVRNVINNIIRSISCGYDFKLLEEYVVVPMQKYSSTLQSMGAFLLWFGWYGFNLCGLSTILSKDAIDTAGLIIVNTTIGAASGTITSAFVTYYICGEGFELLLSLNGALSGLVSITAGCAVFDPWAAMLVGMIGAVCTILCSNMLLLFGIDDVVDAAAVHVAGGIWGVISAALFAKKEQVELLYNITGDSAKGLFYGGDGKLLGMALLQIISIILYSGIMLYICFSFCKYQNVLRVTEARERDGLDETHHGHLRRTGFDLFRTQQLLSSAVLVERLQRTECKKEGLHKADLVGLCIDTGIEVMPLLQKFDSLTGGSQVLSGRSLEMFTKSLMIDSVPASTDEKVNNNNV